MDESKREGSVIVQAGVGEKGGHHVNADEARLAEMGW